MVEKVLPPDAGTPKQPAVQQRRRIGEPALRAGHGDRLTGESALVQPGQPVQGVPFRHGSRSARSAGHRRCLVGALVLVENVDAPLVALGF